ncbi:MAG: YjbQ family protein [Magnetococcales bacterium]|nr:YjbQ family protein [Magnetococcales bacterium]
MVTTFQIQTQAPQTFVEITDKVVEIVRQSGITSGTCTLFIPHTTAGITINENCDPDVVHDMIHALNGLIPVHGPYRHAEGNSHAHIKASMMGSSVTIPITGNALAFGTWQGIFFTEFDGPRTRKVRVAVQNDA